MKTTTFLVVAAILLSFIVEESDGKVTTVLHHGRIRSLQKKRRRTEKKGQPKANQKGGNHTKHVGYRTQKVGYYLKVFCFLLYKIKRITLFKQNLLVVLAYKNRKCTSQKQFFFTCLEIHQMARVSKLDDRVTEHRSSVEMQVLCVDKQEVKMQLRDWFSFFILTRVRLYMNAIIN